MAYALVALSLVLLAVLGLAALFLAGGDSRSSNDEDPRER
jgi:hypothetical protein